MSSQKKQTPNERFREFEAEQRAKGVTVSQGPLESTLTTKGRIRKGPVVPPSPLAQVPETEGV